MHRKEWRRSPEMGEQGCHCQLKQIALLEKKYCELLKSRGSFDPAVRGARVSLRDNYEDLILNSSSSTYAADVEQALWRLHYRGIEEFRNKIRMLSSSTAGRGNRSNGRQESLLRIVNSFKGFLDETSGYFHGLIVKLRAKYGLPATHSPWEGLMCMNSPGGISHCAVSCHRLFIYLGDLARYRELYAVEDPNKRNWAMATNYYRQAAALCPSSGNPHNQVAVLATYTGDALSAIYHYCRSLAVDAPFVTARENLILLLEKVEIYSGRPHQIRIHLSYIGHPLIGDPLYIVGGRPTISIFESYKIENFAEDGGYERPSNPVPGDCGYFLHAYRLIFHHPATDEVIEIYAPPPPMLCTSSEQSSVV